MSLDENSPFYVPREKLGPDVILDKGVYPDRFYSKENYCTPDKWMGTLMTVDGTKPNKNVRMRYCPKGVGENHLAKTPLHAIRWAILEYTKPGDTVLDPFMGSGTTGIEAMIHGRKTVGCEFEFGEKVTIPQLSCFGERGNHWELYLGDAEEQLDNVKNKSCTLVNFSNPYPDGGDESVVSIKKQKDGSITDRKLGQYKKEGNSGSMKSTQEYWDKMKAIQDKSCEKLKVGGHAVFVIKDMMKKKQVWELHRMLADLMPDNMEHIGTFALPHYPPTLFMSTYEDRWGTRPPLEQVCPIFRKIR